MSSDSVRSYLLGMLEESSAAALEERYFLDREFFLFVQEVETALIQDYLEGRLLPSLRARFEERYLAVPELRRKVEEVRSRRVVGRVRAFRYGVAAAIALACLGGLAYRFHHLRGQVERIPETPVVATLSLSPGVLKTEAASLPRLSLPARTGKVHLLLEMPGQSTRLLCTARISVAGDEGSWTQVWATPQPVWSVSAEGRQKLALEFPSNLLKHGDYLVEVFGSGQTVHESYLFRAVPL